MSGPRDHLTAEEARAVFDYDPATGIVRWKVRRKGIRKGGIAGNGDASSHGYQRVGYKGQRYPLHDVIFLIVEGRWPEPTVDHEDLDPGNNRWANLREANQSQQGANNGLRRNNSSGFKGVTWSPSRERWVAQIMVRGKMVRIGRFKDKEAAAAAYAERARQEFGEFART